MVVTMRVIIVLQILNLPLLTYQIKDCKIDGRSRALKYYKIKLCYKSLSPVIFWKNAADLVDCKQVAQERNGLAFNFNPPEAMKYTNILVPNCQILGCPELGNSSKLKFDIAYDYYSAYGNLNYSENITCIKSMGLFSLTNDTQNYTQSIISCQKMGGDLADVSTEFRTHFLSQIIKDNIPDWYKAAYVGMDDIANEGTFRTASENLLTCSSYRAWAPSHPRSKHIGDDCVTLDSEKMWRVVNCKTELRGLCELYPQRSLSKHNGIANITCDHISENQKGKKKKCLNRKQIYEIYEDSSRVDKCGLINYE